MDSIATVVAYDASRRTDFERLNLEWISRWFAVEEPDRLILGDPDQYVLAAGGRILFAVAPDGRTIGTVALRHEGDGVFELTKMAVDPAERGVGCGRLLATAAVDLFVELGGAHLYLETNTRLAPAIALYESIGFEHRPLPADSPYGRVDVHMVWVPGRT